MKPPPPDIVEMMNHIVNCPVARAVAVMGYLLNVQGLLSLPAEHTEQMVAAMENDKETMRRKSHAKTVMLYKAVTECAQGYREAIRARLAELGMAPGDIPCWVE